MKPSFYSSFRWILLGTGTFATANCSYSSIANCHPPRTDTNEQTVPTDELEEALADLEISLTECVHLCEYQDWEQVDGCSLTLGAGSLDGIGGGDGLGGAGGASGGEVPVTCQVEGIAYYCEGRRHRSWGRREAAKGASPVGRFLAHAAANEAASVQSFRCLASELGRNGVHMKHALRRAARQEVGHARLLDRLVSTRGCQRPKQSFARGPERSLLQIALENAREGCVAETYAGLIALHQAMAAGDPEIRQAFAIIAPEEAEHAELAWTLHAEFRKRLSPAECSELDGALDRAIAELEAQDVDWASGLASEGDIASIRLLASALGMPSPGVARSLRHHLAHVLRERQQRIAA